MLLFQEMVRQIVSGFCRNKRTAEAVAIFEEYKQLAPDVSQKYASSF